MTGSAGPLSPGERVGVRDSLHANLARIAITLSPPALSPGER